MAGCHLTAKGPDCQARRTGHLEEPDSQGDHYGYASTP